MGSSKKVGSGATGFLLEARSHGFLGPGPIDVHLQHSLAFANALEGEWKSPEASFEFDPRPGAKGEGVKLLDLGSGGGVPGMIVADRWPGSRVALLDSSKRRCALLSNWIQEAGWDSKVRVLCGRAEELGRDPELRGEFDAVLARSFGRPSVTAECSAPFLKVDGLLVVSDPPTSPTPEADLSGESRWRPEPLRQLGLEPFRTIADPFHFTILRQREACPERYPRRTGVPAKKPLF